MAGRLAQTPEVGALTLALHQPQDKQPGAWGLHGSGDIEGLKRPWRPSHDEAAP
jgi:hypothetical protein